MISANWGQSLLLCVAFAGLLGCAGDDATTTATGTVTLTVDRALLSVNQTLTAPTATPLGGDAPALGGVVPGAGGATPPAAGDEPTNTPTAPSLGSVPVSGALTVATDLLAAFTANFQMTRTGFSSSSPTCTLFTPYVDVSCSVDGFTVSSAELVGNQSIRAYVTEPGVQGASNSVPVRKFSIAQLASTSGSQFVGDRIGGAVEWNGALYFLARNANSRNKWFKLTTSGVTQLSNTRGNQALDDYDLPDIAQPVAAGSSLYFLARSSQAGYKLFRTDGTTVTQVANHRNDQSVSDGIGQMAALGTDLIYVAGDATGDTKVYKTDGTTVTQVSNTVNDDADSDIPGAAIPPAFVPIGTHVYFVAKNSNDVAKVFRTDGTTVDIVSDTIGDPTVTDNPDLLLEFGGSLYFIAEKAASVFKLFKATGTTVTQVSNTRGNQGVTDNPSLLTVCNGGLYFRAANSNGALKLFRTDGTTVTQVSNTREDQSTTDSIDMVKCMGQNVAFTGRNSSGGRKLFITDGTTTTPVSNTREDLSLADNAADAIEYGDAIYFVADDSAGKAKFYSYRDSQVYRVANINSGQADSDKFAGTASGAGAFIAKFNNRLLFTAVVDGDARDVGKLFAFCDPAEGCE